MSESDRVERFETAYNRIDHALSDLLSRHDGGHRRSTFATKVRAIGHHQHRFARHADFLLEIGELRNAMVHNRTGGNLYLAVPNEQTVLELERIEQLLLAPERVVPRFQRVVMTLSPDDTLADVWHRVRDHGYSRFPIYGREGFLGLLTSNGIARWCAAALQNGRLEIDASSVPLADVLDADHRRERVAFIARDALADEAEALFTRKEPLELVIITEHGRLHERPIGIISAADIVNLTKPTESQETSTP